ncbi:MAG TPA: DCC1-like thiol-disulfide oxidoreductase family protein [Candidatus Nitrosotalea sp.]|nr:DCC1-like thiol-disulfide oxidoreductase family protein [Candidatus Nitrosotalea sp.]
MNTEITEKTVYAAGWIFYDAACAPCVNARQRAGRLFASRGFAWLPLQTPGSAARLRVSESDFARRMHLLLADGQVLYNADALAVLCRSVWWLWPLGAALRVPGFREIGRTTYDWLARNRHCVGGACAINVDQHGRVGLADWLATAAIPAVAGFFCLSYRPWVQMWSLALALGLGFKWLAWRDALAHGACPSPGRAFCWFALWPGMDGRAFLAPTNRPKSPVLAEWRWAAALTIFGAGLIWIISPRFVESHAVIAAWVGMTGVTFLLHFGLIRLLSLVWHACGINAQPIMNCPIYARSLTEFWSTRWNTAFSIPARRLILQPLAHRLGSGVAGFFVFLLSGLIHELVISLPARGGYGLPTLYFLLQWLGLICERSRFGRRLGLSNGFRGWLFTAGVTVGPLCCLFHPTFVTRVVLPFLDALNHP